MDLVKSFNNATDQLIKAGEGSKGGKVIGHTKTGKPVYDAHNHSSYKKFSKKDHLDAMKVHHKEVNKLVKKMNNKKHMKTLNSKEQDSLDDKYNRHEDIAEKHEKKAGKELNKWADIGKDY